VIFARTGSRANTLAAGIQSRLTKFMDFNLRYDFTWIEFDRTNLLLQSGFLNGVRADLARRLSERASFGAEYGIRLAELQEGTRNLAFQELGAIFRYDASPHTSIDAAGGISLLNDRTLNESRSGPYVRGGITYQIQRATVGANFARTFTPTFGFGGSASSQAFRAFVKMPLTRNRVYVQQSVSWRRTDPFLADVLTLDSWWLHSTVGYSMSRWMRVEGFYSFTRQDSRVPGGLINRQRIGAQIVVADPMRIR
jgi:hypothetical protein